MSAPPILEIVSWAVTEVANPEGFRNNPSSHPAFKNILTTDNTAQSLNYGTISIEIGATTPTASTTQAFSFRKTEDDNVYITNMRVWLPSGSAIVPNKAIIQYQNSGVWVPNLAMTSGSYPEFPISLPVAQNIFRQDGFPTMSGVSDNEHSQYGYTNILVAPEHAVGPYGLSGSGNLRFRLTFDYITTDDSIV